MALEFLGSFFSMLLDVMNLVLGNFLDHVDIIVNFIFDVRMKSLKSFIDWSEWAHFFVCRPLSSSSINDMADLDLNAFVRDLFLGIKSDVESELLGVNLSNIVRDFTPVFNCGNVVLAHGVSGTDGVQIEHGLKDFDCVFIESCEKISLVNAFLGVVLAPSKSILKWDNESAVFDGLPDSLDNVIESRFVLIKRDSEEVTSNDFVMKSFNSIKFWHNIVAHAFFRNVINNFVLIESSNSVNVNRSLDVEHISPLLHILRSIIVAVEWGINWGH